MAFKEGNDNKGEFSGISIGLASPDEILRRSLGEVTKPETINFRTYKPERDGLFCERIFGPTKDYECHCGKYKRIRYRGIVCDRCGVEVTERRVRRERAGHIELVVPIAHIWYFRSLPNKIGYLLGLTTKNLDALIYYERHIVVQPGAKEKDGVEKMQLLTEEEYYEHLESLPVENRQLPDEDPNKFIAETGAPAIERLLRGLNLDELSQELRIKVRTETSQQRKNDALKRLQVIEAFRASKDINRPEWMIVRIIPVIPPELRPLVPLDGGRFATSDLNDLYRRVIIRNNRLKKLIDIKAPDVILRNEKRMLQEAVDALFDNSRRTSAIRAENNRALKSLSDSLKGKQGRFRQNLLGKRVDYSARSVVVVGPQLKLYECGLPKEMAAELYKPFIIRRLLERGIVKTVKSAKKIIEQRAAVVWEILEYLLMGHPVLLNRAPTLHRLSIQAFQPRLVEGKAIQLHPLSCTGFNADFDGDQMAVHLPLSQSAVLEAQLLMLSSHNILNPANGAPITIPSQDMVLGLYYMTKEREGAKGEGMLFYDAEEAVVAYNEKRVALHAKIKVRYMQINDKSQETNNLIETTVGRVLFNSVVPQGIGYINRLITKKNLREIITEIFEQVGNAQTAKFLDDIKHLGYTMAYRGGLSFNLRDVIIPKEKQTMVQEGYEQVEGVMGNYNMGLITNTERYNQVIDIWTHVNSNLTNTVLDFLRNDNQGFNSVFMMLDSGARGSKEQIRQLCGMRGLMAKPQKSGAVTAQIIENPILSNFKEGLSVLEYFISTHGARKGLADTALKTADAGYLTRRLVDVAQDVIIRQQDCGTLLGLEVSAIHKNEEVVASLSERIEGRCTVHDLHHPKTNELLIVAGEVISPAQAKRLEEVGIERIEIRSALTCEAPEGICAKCYGRNLATGQMVQEGEAVGVIAAQSIGEPGTQLTLRTFHVGGIAGNVSTQSSFISRHDAVVEFDELRTVTYSSPNSDDTYEIVVSRMCEAKTIDKATRVVLSTQPVPYGSKLFVKNKEEVSKYQLICEWDPWNAVIVAEQNGQIAFENFIEGVTFREEQDEQTGFKEKITIESRDKTKLPVAYIQDAEGERLQSFNLPIGGHLSVDEGEPIVAGQVIMKIPRAVGKAGDITGGLPRVTELFEARNPSNPAVISEIDGEIEIGRIKRTSREIFVTSKTGEKRTYLVPLARQILVQENDYVKAGTPLSDGAVTPADILAVKGPTEIQNYIVNEVQEVYRMQGVKINDKHFEIIVSRMMSKVQIEDSGDTTFLPKQIVDKRDFQQANDRLYGCEVVEDVGNSDKYIIGDVVSRRELREENAKLVRMDKHPMKTRPVIFATSSVILQGITKAALQTSSWISAASFQETTKVLNNVAISGRKDSLNGLKENVICGQLIPAGVGIRKFRNMLVGSQLEYNSYKSKLAL